MYHQKGATADTMNSVQGYHLPFKFFFFLILGCNVFVNMDFFQLLGHYFWLFPLNGKTTKRIFILPHRYVFHKQGTHLHKTSLHCLSENILDQIRYVSSSTTKG